MLSCWHQNFGPNWLSASAQGLYTCIKIWKNVHKIRGQSCFLKCATSDQSDKTFLLPWIKKLSLWVVLLWGYKVWNKISYKIIYEAKGILLELVQNDGSNRSFKMLPVFKILYQVVVCPCHGTFFSNDDPGLTLTIFMTSSILFPDASVWVTAHKALSAHVFPSLF